MQAPSAISPAAAIAVIGLGTLIAPLDTAVNVAFPAITAAFEIPVRDIQWIITMFGLAQASLTLIFGKLGDRFGHRTVFMVGLVISALALSFCALATTFPMLVVARVIQGVGAGLLMACGPALITFVLSADQRRQALAFYTMMMGIGMCLGPLAGGMLVQVGDWQAVYWARVPIALLALLLVWRLQYFETNQELVAARMAARALPFDRGGAWALFAALILLVFVIVELRDPWFGYGSIAIALVFCVGAFARLRQTAAQAANPIIDLRHFNNPLFRNLQIAAVFIQITTFSLFLLMPYRLVDWPDISLVGAGVMLALFPAGTVLAGLGGAMLSVRLSGVFLVAGGMLLAGCGLLAVGAFSAMGSIGATGTAMFITGVGLGTFQVGHLDATVSAMTVGDRGVAGSLVSVERVLGFALSANLVMWLHDTLRDHDSGVFDYARTLMIMGAATVVAAVVFLVVRPARRSRTY